jgi:hypothetical protein
MKIMRKEIHFRNYEKTSTVYLLIVLKEKFLEIKNKHI